MPEYIDLGSATSWNFSVEHGIADVSIYPSTLLYLSCNKIPDLDSNLLDFIETEQNEMMEDQANENSLLATMKTTCKKAKGNGKG